MKYPKEYLDEIKSRLKVSTVVSKTVDLKKRGEIQTYFTNLTEDNLKVCQHYITENPGYDVYRSKEVQFTTNTTYMGLFGSVNNGNIFTKKYVASLGKKQLSVNEDQYMLFDGKPRVYTFDFPSMIYRWGMGTYHISGMSITDPAEVNNRTDKFGPMEKGIIRLEPKWKTNYYEIVKGVANG